MNIRTLVVGAIRANCYLIWNERACVLIDPGDDADRIHDATGIDTRLTILGHIQRGGSPSSQDRIMATRMGYAAVMALEGGKSKRVVVMQGGHIVDLDIEEALSMAKDLNQSLFEAQSTVAI